MKTIALVLIPLFLGACSSMPNAPRDIEGLPAVQYANAKTVEEIRALKPQAQLPMKIAVMPRDRWHLSQEERQLVEKLGADLHAIGFAKSLDVVPRQMIPQCSRGNDPACFLNESRLAGARLGADAILFLNETTDTDEYANPLSLLNLTIVGMWIAPAHHRESHSLYEAALFDINNGYLYAVAEANGESKIVRPYMYLERETGKKEARIAALEALSKKLVTMSKEHMQKFGVQTPERMR